MTSADRMKQSGKGTPLRSTKIPFHLSVWPMRSVDSKKRQTRSFRTTKRSCLHTRGSTSPHCTAWLSFDIDHVKENRSVPRLDSQCLFPSAKRPRLGRFVSTGHTRISSSQNFSLHCPADRGEDHHADVRRPKARPSLCRRAAHRRRKCRHRH